MPSPAPSEKELRELRRLLLRRASNGLDLPDAEDVTQEALLRLVRDRPGNGVPLRKRAYRKLKDTRAELFRGNQRKFEAASLPLSEATEQGSDEVEEVADLLALEQQVTEVVGPEGLAYALAKAEGLTNAEIVDERGWSAQRVDAARKKLSRKSGALASLMNESAPHRRNDGYFVRNPRSFGRSRRP